MSDDLLEQRTHELAVALRVIGPYDWASLIETVKQLGLGAGIAPRWMLSGRSKNWTVTDALLREMARREVAEDKLLSMAEYLRDGMVDDARALVLPCVSPKRSDATERK